MHGYALRGRRQPRTPPRLLRRTRKYCGSRASGQGDRLERLVAPEEFYLVSCCFKRILNGDSGDAIASLTLASALVTAQSPSLALTAHSTIRASKRQLTRTRRRELLPGRYFYDAPGAIACRYLGLLEAARLRRGLGRFLPPAAAVERTGAAARDHRWTCGPRPYGVPSSVFVVRARYLSPRRTNFTKVASFSVRLTNTLPFRILPAFTLIT